MEWYWIVIILLAASTAILAVIVIIIWKYKTATLIPVLGKTIVPIVGERIGGKQITIKSTQADNRDSRCLNRTPADLEKQELRNR